jgi:hypothetical protein
LKPVNVLHKLIKSEIEEIFNKVTKSKSLFKNIGHKLQDPKFKYKNDQTNKLINMNKKKSLQVNIPKSYQEDNVKENVNLIESINNKNSEHNSIKEP